MKCLLVIALCGCGRLGFDNVPSGTVGDAANLDTLADDALGGDASSGVCAQPGTFCAFDGMTNCSCWGVSFQLLASVTQSNGRIEFAPNTNQPGAEGACRRINAPFAAAGIFVEVSQIVSGTTGETMLDLGTGSDRFSITVSGTSMTFFDGSNSGSTSYDPGSMRWWRIRPLANGTLFETSPDGISWTPKYMTGRLASPEYDVRIVGRTAAGEAAPGAARFEGINVCP